MIVLFRALTYATLFIGLLLVFLPFRILEQAGVAPPAEIGAMQIAGMLVIVAGAALAIASILTFTFVGKGTPAPFDPPRQLVVAGPYRWVRNPMYIGAGLILAGAALYHQSLALLAYLGVMALIIHLFVALYEEPTLRRMFGQDYEAYCGSVHRWLPRRV